MRVLRVLSFCNLWPFSSLSLLSKVHGLMSEPQSIIKTLSLLENTLQNN